MTHAYIASYFADCTTSYPHVKQGDPVRCPNVSQLATLRRCGARRYILACFPAQCRTRAHGCILFRMVNRFCPAACNTVQFSNHPTSTVTKRCAWATRRNSVTCSPRCDWCIVGVNDGFRRRSCLQRPLVIRQTASSHPIVWKDTGSGASLQIFILVAMANLAYQSERGVPYYSRDGVLCDCVGVVASTKFYAMHGKEIIMAAPTCLKQSRILIFSIKHFNGRGCRKFIGRTELLDEHKGKMEVVNRD